MDVTLSQARERWSEVVERLQQGDQVVLTNAKSGQAALLRRPEESDRAPAGTWTSTRARQELGSLISAAQEEPQLLTVGARPAAIVLRHQAPAGQPQREAEPGVTGLGDVLDGLLETAPQHSGLSTGVAALDRACGGLARGSVTLVAAPPNAGGSLLPLQAARAAAFHSEQPTPVLYVPSGVPLQVAARRLIAAEAPVPYAQFAMRHSHGRAAPGGPRRGQSAACGAPVVHQARADRAGDHRRGVPYRGAGSGGGRPASARPCGGHPALGACPAHSDDVPGPSRYRPAGRRGRTAGHRRCPDPGPSGRGPHPSSDPAGRRCHGPDHGNRAGPGHPDGRGSGAGHDPPASPRPARPARPFHGHTRDHTGPPGSGASCGRRTRTRPDLTSPAPTSPVPSALERAAQVPPARVRQPRYTRTAVRWPVSSSGSRARSIPSSPTPGERSRRQWRR